MVIVCINLKQECMNSLDWVKERSGTIGIDESFWTGRDVANFINDYNYLNDLTRFSAEVKHFQKAENWHKGLVKLLVIIAILQIVLYFTAGLSLIGLLITGCCIAQSLYFIGVYNKNRTNSENKLTEHIKNKNNIL